MFGIVGVPEAEPSHYLPEVLLVVCEFRCRQQGYVDLFKLDQLHLAQLLCRSQLIFLCPDGWHARSVSLQLVHEPCRLHFGRSIFSYLIRARFHCLRPKCPDLEFLLNKFGHLLVTPLDVAQDVVLLPGSFERPRIVIEMMYPLIQLVLFLFLVIQLVQFLHALGNFWIRRTIKCIDKSILLGLQHAQILLNKVGVTFS